MKKLLAFALAISLALTGMAQGNHKEKGKKNKTEKHNSKSYDKSHDDNDDNDDDNYDKNRKKRNGNEGVYQEGKYSKNLPAKVRASFNRDYPNATNVNWTKNNGYWIATFPNGAYQTSATYSANGQKINGATSKNLPRRTTTTDDGSIWDRILSKQ